ncbi:MULTISPECIES: BCCT family transporter [unclassified Avibacterium]|uniref:BCCT family transporter n=1 Tax=unclassified Avibacterium TaxID=2685287 RepID=UPI002025BCEB|nr:MULTISPECIES: BCCT family transporter [unclassified Avibacterium]URL01797.1 BCCT family transporter [Avibacterium sp. 20-126]MCW9698870.1 BCCT family transporter [Avibacterium sp. 20-129]MCW9718965.1 BCCT family transporter [Avibacterium sp. 21-599]MCW9733220.1 BCCT family transporter [Avibacterium sp. 20-15]URL05337.1 BCCT family transporter [Avibacterium sp. 20-132]
MSFSTFIHKRSSFNPFVIGATLLLVLLLLAATLILPEKTTALLNWAKAGVFANFSWFYILAFSIFLCFLFVLSVSSLGNIKLGANEEEPEFSFLSWLAMLFAAGMGVGLMFFGVAEPLTHYFSSITTGSAEHKQQEALLHTFFHWGIHAWAVYGVIALALAYFGFRYKLPLALRSCFYPLLKDRINGKIGDVIDIMALIATLFGIITTLGFGAAQLGAGLTELGVVQENSFGLQTIIIVVVMSIAVFSAISGVGKGVKLLSEINLGLALTLMLFILVAGPTLYLLTTFSDNIGIYLSNLVRLSFKTYAYETENTAWFTGWTVLYWAWWCSWAPFVGLFIARISRGRTIREFIFGVLAVPSLFSILWFTVFGDSAIWLELNVANGALHEFTSAPEKLLFKFLDYLPLSALTGTLALVIISLFFITSADSGIYVLNNMASRDKSLSAPRWQAMMWGVVMMVLAIVLMREGGLGTLQTMTLLVALPFAMLMLVMCVSLWKGLNADQKYFAAKVTPTSLLWTGEKWKERLGQMLNQTQEKDIVKFLKRTALPAMRELRQELVEVYNLNVDVVPSLDAEEPSVELIIKKESMRDFIYGVKSVSHEISSQLVDDENLPHIQHSITYQPMTYFADGRTGYDVQYMTRDELIADILRQYERYISLLEDVGQELMSHEQTELAE